MSTLRFMKELNKTEIEICDAEDLKQKDAYEDLPSYKRNQHDFLPLTISQVHLADIEVKNICEGRGNEIFKSLIIPRQ